MVFLLWSLIAVLPLGQQVRVDTSGGGDGPVTLTTFATYVGRNSADFGPLTLQALVLWHGEPNWYTNDWSSDEEGIHTPTRSLGFKFNGNSVTVDGQTIPLAGINVILLEVEPTRTRVVDTLYIDAVIPLRNTQDPIQALLRRHPRLAQFADMQP
jgi:hypothetical protein